MSNVEDAKAVLEGVTKKRDQVLWELVRACEPIMPARGFADHEEALRFMKAYSEALQALRLK